MLTLDSAASLMLRVCTVSIVISCAEIIYAHRDYTGSGLQNWEIIRTIYPWDTEGTFARVLDAILRYPRFIWLVSLLLLVAIGLATLKLGEHATIYLLTIVIIIWFLIQLRLRFGLDGADQMASIILIALWLYYLSDDVRLRTASIVFVALQLILSYVAAGVAKLLSEDWRSGSAISGILRTQAYGTPTVAVSLEQYPRLSRAICYSVIAFECLGWVCILGGSNWSLGFLATAFIFHISCAFLMGLNTFLWSFLSGFPAVIVLSRIVG
jgi:hypothetical protein